MPHSTLAVGTEINLSSSIYVDFIWSLSAGCVRRRFLHCFKSSQTRTEVWPHFEPPTEMPLMTVFDVALAESDQEHIKLVREWASFVWGKWSAHHQQIRSFVAEHF